MKIKSILVKSIAVTALSVTGLVAANNNTNTAQAAIVENDTDVVTVKNVSDNAPLFTTATRIQRLLAKLWQATPHGK